MSNPLKGLTPSDRIARRRIELVDAAIALVRSEGPFVSMEQIAAACGVTKPIIYRHFGDRDGLVLEIALRFVDQLVTDLRSVSFDVGSARSVLAATMDAYLALIERDTSLYRFTSNHAGADRRDLMAGLVAEEVAVVLERRLAASGLDATPARPWAYGLVGMVHFAGDWWSDEQRIPRAELVEWLLVLTWDGLGSLQLDEPSAASMPEPKIKKKNRAATATGAVRSRTKETP